MNNAFDRLKVDWMWLSKESEHNYTSVETLKTEKQIKKMSRKKLVSKNTGKKLLHTHNGNTRRRYKQISVVIMAENFSKLLSDTKPQIQTRKR